MKLYDCHHKDNPTRGAWRFRPNGKPGIMRLCNTHLKMHELGHGFQIDEIQRTGD